MLSPIVLTKYVVRHMMADGAGRIEHLLHHRLDRLQWRIAGRSALRRLPEADDVASVVEYLLGEGGRNIIGTFLTLDAGNTA